MTRRSFLVAGTSALALAACGGSSGSSASPTSGSSSSSSTAPKRVLVYYSAAEAMVPGIEQRWTLGVRESTGGVATDVPPSLAMTVVGSDGKPIGAPITAVAHSEGIPTPYYAMPITFPAAGDYFFSTTLDGEALSLAATIPSSSPVPAPGQPMIPFETPTVADPKGVELLCTRSPGCPLHDVTLTQALAEKRPLAFLVATPAYCQVQVCGPVLDVLLSMQAEFPQVRMLHSEVYPSKAAAQGAHTVVPVIGAYSLTYEPALFLAKPNGVIDSRLDTIFDAGELRSALTKLVS